MGQAKSTPAERQWEKALYDAYREHRYRQVYEWLYDRLAEWKQGALSNEQADAAVHEAHCEQQRLYGLFQHGRTAVAKLAMGDEDFFDPWVAAHPPPVPIRPEALAGEDPED